LYNDNQDCFASKNSLVPKGVGEIARVDFVRIYRGLQCQIHLYKTIPLNVVATSHIMHDMQHTAGKSWAIIDPTRNECEATQACSDLPRPLPYVLTAVVEVVAGVGVGVGAYQLACAGVFVGAYKGVCVVLYWCVCESCACRAHISVYVHL